MAPTRLFEVRRALAEQVVAGVSTRGCGRSLEPLDESLESRGESKSNASRALTEKTTEKLADFLSRKLAAMFIDGIEIGGHAVIIALGVTKDGTKVPLGVWCGSTENHVVTARAGYFADRREKSALQAA